jgi:2-polyprenyl-3-methyl-5-hydroxy-6-metoxy-1,4-benzoquinol methylase
MNDELRTRLIEQYGSHYASGYASVDPRTMTRNVLQSYEMMYGDLVAALAPSSRILDAGCGSGFVLAWLRRHSNIVPIGVDSSAEQVAVARRSLPDVQIFCGDAVEYMQQHPKTFAGIFCTDVLEHIPTPTLLEFVEAVRAALVPNGFFVCRVPNAANLTGTQMRYIDLTHERSFCWRSLFQLLTVAGLEKCRLIPVRVPHLSGRTRLLVERWLHQIVYLICGHGGEPIFTRTLSAVAYNPERKFANGDT